MTRVPKVVQFDGIRSVWEPKAPPELLLEPFFEILSRWRQPVAIFRNPGQLVEQSPVFCGDTRTHSVCVCVCVRVPV